MKKDLWLKVIFGVIILVGIFAGVISGLQKKPKEVQSDDPSIVSLHESAVNNFYKSDTQTGAFGEATLRSQESYKIIYYPEDQLFVIAILMPPFEETRLKAERDFMETLGVTAQEACDLNAVVSTSPSVSKEKSGKNHKLSWCQI